MHGHGIIAPNTSSRIVDENENLWMNCSACLFEHLYFESVQTHLILNTTGSWCTSQIVIQKITLLNNIFPGGILYQSFYISIKNNSQPIQTRRWSRWKPNCYGWRSKTKNNNSVKIGALKPSWSFGETNIISLSSKNLKLIFLSGSDQFLSLGSNYVFYLLPLNQEYELPLDTDSMFFWWTPFVTNWCLS